MPKEYHHHYHSQPMDEIPKKKLPLKRKDDGIEVKLKKMIQKEVTKQNEQLLSGLTLDLSDVVNEAIRSERRNFMAFLTFLSIGFGCICLLYAS
jgi:hypothetical protein